jgi:MFS family permease
VAAKAHASDRAVEAPTDAPGDEAAGPAGRPVAGDQPLREDAQFRRFLLARLVTLAGTMVTLVAMPVLVYDLSGSPLLTASVAALEALPYLLFGLVAGALADRWDRRRVMVVTDLVSGATMATLPLAYAFDMLTVPHVMVVAFVGPALFVFFDAADFGALPAIVGKARIAAANSAMWSTGTVVEIAVPAAAGAALALVAAPWLLIADAVSFLGSALLILSVTRPMSIEDRPSAPLRPRLLAADVAEGLRWLWRHPSVRSMTFIGTTQAVAGGAFVGQMVVWADKELDVRAGDPRLGTVFAAWSVGSLAATLVMPRLAARLGAARVALLALPVSAALAVAVALAPVWWLATLLVAAWGAAYILVVVNAITYRQQVTPDHLMSRVNTTGRMLSFGLGWPVGAVLGGVVSQAAGPVAGLLSGAVVLAGGAVGAWLSPLRHEPAPEVAAAR